MDKIWLQEYPEGVPAEIDVNEFPSLREFLEQSFSKYSSLPAFTNMGHSISFGELDEMSRYLGAWLQKNAGLAKGDCVAIMMPNVIQYAVAVAAILRAGLTVTNVNPLYTPRELEHQLKDSGAKAIILVENFAATLQKVRHNTPIKTVVVTAIGDMLPVPKRHLVNFVIRKVKKMVPAWDIPDAVPFHKALKEGKWQTMDTPPLGHDDIAFLQYTGGTTGVAKGAMLTHRNIIANLLQARAWLSVTVVEGQSVVITPLPLYHIFSLTANFFVFTLMGGNNILITNPRDMPGFVKELKKQKFTFITGVNTLFNGLLNTPGFDEVDFSHLRVTLGGGMAVQAAVAERWQQVTGKPLIQAYGLTETSPAASINPLTQKEFNGSIGVPISSTEFSIRDEDGKELGIGAVGEICIRGPQVMAGYWNRPDETDKVMLEGGWFRSGDMGRMDERGYIFIEDRKKDMILVSGFNVYPNEVEGVAVTHPAVLEAAAVGIPDEKSGEMVKLFVVCREGQSVTEKELINFCREGLTGYKVPRKVEFRKELPKTNVGKILRRELRDEAS
ncbi:long-chain-fatty-acid--CoA ligase [Thioalkalivibrio sp. XN279]|uniref:long-chain-fatty-acid--CoA ligase n=1 Tax=Thioalkalivibrio sp. XN279 TaxID=2714953 RepID=UPI00140A3AD0|nr:long-chain-fatty-acid--CoA ligase [Thioalkalivibrio sp. XN279]NHA13695.1 long-chain-fatty-acid--CoA ligase [Thioalkalivibrio sp. XN279]